MSSRRAVALVLALGLLEPGAAALAAAAGAAAHECTDHVCRCAKRTAPKHSSGNECHGPSRESASCEMRAGCSHDALPTLAARPYLAPAAPVARIARRSEPAPSAAVPEHRPGFSRIDPRPPRTL